MRTFVHTVAAIVIAHSLASAQTFTINTTPRRLLIGSGNAMFAVHVSPGPGFNASVFISASCPSLPATPLIVSKPIQNSPYTDSARIIISLTGKESTGAHAVIVQGRNGPNDVADTVILDISSKAAPAWRVFDTSNSVIPSNTVTALALDQAGTAWIGTTRGLARFDGTTWTVFDAASGFPLAAKGAVRIQDIAIDDGGNVYVASTSALCSYTGGHWTSIEVNPDLYAFGSITGIAAGHSGTLWIACDGLLKYDGTSMTLYNEQNSNITLTKTNSITVDNADTVWIGSDFEMVRFDGRFWSTYDCAVGQNGAAYGLTKLTVDGGNALWIPSLYGLKRHDANGFQTYSVLEGDPAKSDSFPGKQPNLIMFDELGDAWIAEGNDGGALPNTIGLAWYHAGRRDLYTVANSGLPDSAITALQVGPNTVVWVGTQTHGLAILDGHKSGYKVQSGVADNPLALSARLITGVYPNPVTSISDVQYSVPEGMHARVTIVNALGATVESIFNGEAGPGSHTLHLDAGTLPAGVYFLRIEAGSMVDSRPVSIVR